MKKSTININWIFVCVWKFVMSSMDSDPCVDGFLEFSMKLLNVGLEVAVLEENKPFFYEIPFNFQVTQL